MRKFNLDAALAMKTAMRNFKAKVSCGEMVYSAQFPAGEGAVWALEVAFTRFGQWGWRTGARHLPRDSWVLVVAGDARCWQFAECVCDQLQNQIEALHFVERSARQALAANPF